MQFASFRPGQVLRDWGGALEFELLQASPTCRGAPRPCFELGLWLASCKQHKATLCGVVLPFLLKMLSTWVDSTTQWSTSVQKELLLSSCLLARNRRDYFDNKKSWWGMLSPLCKGRRRTLEVRCRMANWGSARDRASFRTCCQNMGTQRRHK